MFDNISSTSDDQFYISGAHSERNNKLSFLSLGIYLERIT